MLSGSLCACGCGGVPRAGNRFIQYHHLKEGEQHHSWKGNDVGYTALHLWVSKHKVRSGVCEPCGARPAGKGTEFANISGEYKRDIEDYIELCCSCHKVFDNWREKSVTPITTQGSKSAK